METPPTRSWVRALGKLVPFERLQIHVARPVDVVAARLGGLVRARGPVGFGLTHALLGEFDGRHFRVRRGIGAANAWRPVIEGELLDRGDATLLQARLRLSWPMAALMLVFYALLGWALAAQLPRAPRQSWLAGIMIALAYAVMMAGFKYESARSRRLLVDTLTR